MSALSNLLGERRVRCEATWRAGPRIDSSELLPGDLMPRCLPHATCLRPNGPAGAEERDEASDHGSTHGVDRGSGARYGASTVAELHLVHMADSTGRCDPLISASAGGVLQMKCRTRIYYTETQKALM